LSAGVSNFVQLPSGIISNYTALTVEGWVTAQTLPGNSMYYAFGDTDAGGAGQNYIFGSLVRDYTAITGVDPGYTGEQGTAGGGALPLNTPIHFVGVYNPPAGYLALYTNGVLQSINAAETDPLSVVSSVKSFIGRSLYTGDPYASIALDEFRIYNGAMSPFDVAATQILGPNYPLSPALKASIGGGAVTLSWPTNYAATAAFTLQSRTNLILGTWQTEASPPVVGTQFQLTVPAFAGGKFYRLAR